ncbi:hypothetical protein ABZ605_27850 [Streptomyces sp. NPDC012765]|uniref:hypothetical protein n=1 Tax=Streptomyces sp. NPDC012765 TaxID=3155249 RepID=UPI0033E0BF5B
MDTNFGRELGQRLFQRYGSRSHWPKNLAMAATSLQVLEQYLSEEAFDVLMTCATEANDETRALMSVAQTALDQLRRQEATQPRRQRAGLSASRA